MLSTRNLNEVHSYLIGSPQQCEVQQIWNASATYVFTIYTGTTVYMKCIPLVEI